MNLWFSSALALPLINNTTSTRTAAAIAAPTTYLPRPDNNSPPGLPFNAMVAGWGAGAIATGGQVGDSDGALVCRPLPSALARSVLFRLKSGAGDGGAAGT